jgi:hypothetical protein
VHICTRGRARKTGPLAFFAVATRSTDPEEGESWTGFATTCCLCGLIGVRTVLFASTSKAGRTRALRPLSKLTVVHSQRSTEECSPLLLFDLAGLEPLAKAANHLSRALQTLQPCPNCLRPRHHRTGESLPGLRSISTGPTYGRWEPGAWQEIRRQSSHTRKRPCETLSLETFASR